MTTPLLAASDIHKRFGHAHVLKGIDFAVYPAEICALIGDNGAGKSTLVKILSGAEKPTRGELSVSGKRVSFSSPGQAQQHGIATVYQDLALAPALTPSDNLFLGNEMLRPGVLGRFGILDRAEMRRRAAEQFARLGVKLRSAKVPVSSLSGGQRQSVAIARAAMWADKVIFMDEPTAALGVVQTERVLELIRQVKKAGISVVLISHNMPQVLEIADRVVVLRLGQNVAEFKAGEASVESLVAAMTSGVAKTGRGVQ